ncbi:fumarylacetoacetate hydrolase family protein [Verticiella sediminum]|uniref:Fumarylacetoacetate hydrolase family protein n=1 Tax=Verticiella sediminum TaxID=1247510 RepID=A0A556AKJ9_9BURK|nr:fumarylacetoacetate hydrolase family protein [Verticiella sediminum]TSH93375.1 fumarylacetoacetate hydrolase family protein [Verticiella sediminum]
MKLLTYLVGDTPRLGLLDEGDIVLDLTSAWRAGDAVGPAPASVGELIAGGETALRHVEALVPVTRALAQPALPADEVTWLAPIPRVGRNVFCVGRNYREHIIEGNLARGRDPDDFPKAIEFFTKPPSSVVGHRARVRRHAGVTGQLDYEVELGIVIGKGGADIQREHAMAHVFGYTIVNDVSARDLQSLHGQWFKGKSLDTSCPVGPVIVTRDEIADPGNLDLSMHVNGQLRQQANTSSMLFDVATIVAELSRGMTLEPGDIIATGTPSGVALGMKPPCWLQEGDRMVAEVAGIGRLENVVGA